MKVIQCGYNYRHDTDYTTDRPEGLDEYLLLIIRSPAHIRISNADHYIKNNAVILYRKGTPQYIAAHNSEYINDWILFRLNKKDLSLISQLAIPFDTVIELSDVAKLSHYISLLFEERYSPRNRNNEQTKIFLLRLLLLKLSDLISNSQQYSSPLYIGLTILRNDILWNPQEDWSIDSICKKLSIGSTYLYKTYTELFGTSIKEDVIQARINRAKHLLTTTTYNITTISNMVGYPNDTHFMYIFRKKVGMTPSQYRKSFSTYFDYLRGNTQWSKAHPELGQPSK